MSRKINEILDLCGGPAEVALIPKTIPREQFLELKKWMSKFTRRTLTRASDHKIDLVFSASPNVDARVFPIHPGRSVIVTSIGLFARTYALARRLYSKISEINKAKKLIQFANSPADYYDPQKFFVPKLVRPIFAEYESAEQFWSDLAAFDAENLHDSGTDYWINSLIHMVYGFVLSRDSARVL